MSGCRHHDGVGTYDQVADDLTRAWLGSAGQRAAELVATGVVCKGCARIMLGTIAVAGSVHLEGVIVMGDQFERMVRQAR
ncbi:MAG: hypothetical protein AB7H92_14150, partial [Microbacteriaceae bacterium]